MNKLINQPNCKLYLNLTNLENEQDFKSIGMHCDKNELSIHMLFIAWKYALREIPESWNNYEVSIMDELGNVIEKWNTYTINKKG